MAYPYDDSPYNDNPYANPFAQPYQMPAQPTGPIPLYPSSTGNATFTNQSQGNADAAAAAGRPNPLPVTPAKPASAAGYSGPKDFSSLINYWKQSHPATGPIDIAGLIAFMNAQGVPVSNAMHNGMSSDDKLLYNGQTYDLGSSFGSPQGAWFDQFNPQGADGGGGAGAFSLDPSYLSPFTKPFNLPSDASLPTFQMPKLSDDPGYQFRQDEGRKSIEAAASSKGLLNSGGTLADILGYSQGLASQEFQKVFDRAYDLYGLATNRANTTRDRAQQDWQQQRDLWFKNQDSPFGKLLDLSKVGY